MTLSPFYWHAAIFGFRLYSLWVTLFMHIFNIHLLNGSRHIMLFLKLNLCYIQFRLCIGSYGEKKHVQCVRKSQLNGSHFICMCHYYERALATTVLEWKSVCSLRVYIYASLVDDFGWHFPLCAYSFLFSPWISLLLSRLPIQFRYFPLTFPFSLLVSFKCVGAHFLSVCRWCAFFVICVLAFLIHSFSSFKAELVCLGYTHSW